MVLCAVRSTAVTLGVTGVTVSPGAGSGLKSSIEQWELEAPNEQIECAIIYQNRSRNILNRKILYHLISRARLAAQRSESKEETKVLKIDVSPRRF